MSDTTTLDEAPVPLDEHALREATAVAVRDLVQHRRALPSPAVCRALRTGAGLTVDDLARAMGVTRQAVSNWELGLRRPRGRYLDVYLEALRALRESA